MYIVYDYIEEQMDFSIFHFQLFKDIVNRQDIYSLFHKFLPKCILQMHWVSVRFYEMDDT